MLDKICFKIQAVELRKELERGFEDLLKDVSIERSWPESDVIRLTIWPGVARKTWVAIGDKEEIVGGFTLLEGNPSSLPISLDCPGLVFSESLAAEVSISGVQKAYRGLDSSSHVFACMYGTLYWHLVKNGIGFVHAILDRGICALYKRKLGLNFVRIGEDFVKWNEVVFPAKLDISTVEDLLVKTKPDVWQTFLHYQPVELKTKIA